MTNVNWIRSIALQIGTVYTDQLHIEFTIDDSSTDATAVPATICIYNPAPATIARIRTGDLIKLWAGYLDDMGIIYLGRVAASAIKHDAADKYLEIQAIDHTWPTTMQPRTYPAGTPISTIARQLYTDAAIPVSAIINDLGVTTTGPYTSNPDGKTTLGEIISLINGDPMAIALGISVRHIILGGQAAILASNQTTQDVYLLTPATGLLEVSPDASEDTDLTVKTLINWRVQTGAIAKLESSTVTGWYKIVGYKHTANDQVYQTEIKLQSTETAV